MEIIEDGLEVSLDEFLARRLFCFLAQRSGEGPRLSPLWFLWEDGAVWNVAQLDGRSYPERVRAYPETAVAVVDFDPATGRVEVDDGESRLRVRSHPPGVRPAV